MGDIRLRMSLSIFIVFHSVFDDEFKEIHEVLVIAEVFIHSLIPEGGTVVKYMSTCVKFFHMAGY